MNNIPTVKLGIVACSADWLPSDEALASLEALINHYGEKYDSDSVHGSSICVTDNEVSVKRAIKDILKAECNALCIYYANYGAELAGTMLATEVSMPVMMMGAADESNEPMLRERRDSLSGFINACYALSIRNNTDVYIPPHPIGTIDQCASMLHDYIPIARTINALRDLKIISIAPRPSSYLASYAPMHGLYDLGVEISEYSELELYNSYNKHRDDPRIEKTVQDMNNEIDCEVGIDSELLKKLAQYEITISDWIKVHKGNKKYYTLTSTCWPAFPVSFGFVPCYVNSRFTARGIPVACEADVFGAFSEYIGQCICNDSVTILNINNNIPLSLYDCKIRGVDFNGNSYKRSDLFLAYHCGVTCVERLSSKRFEVHFVNNQLIGSELSGGTIQGQIQAGAVTIFRIQPSRDGSLKAYVAQGELLPVEVDTYGGRGIVAISEFERFLRNVIIEEQFPNHTILLFGNYASQIKRVLRTIGIKNVFFNHPQGLLYKNEIIF